jgi:hypothetical protein
MNCSDEDISWIQVDRLRASATTIVPLEGLRQNSLGDTDGNPNDGNPAADGEYGDYYSAPAAAAVAAKLWYDRGYTEVMKDNLATLTLAQLAEHLAEAFRTRANRGTYDEDLMYGLKSYFADHGDDLNIDYLRSPSYYDIRKWSEEEGRAVMLGLGGSPGLWVTLAGFGGWQQPDQTWPVSCLVPLTGSIEDLALRESGTGCEVLLGIEWHPVDLMVSMLARTWTIDRDLVGVDLMGADGWSVTWVPAGLSEDDFCYFRAQTEDAALYKGFFTTLLQYSCSQVYLPGDYNDDDIRNMSDLYYLIDYIALDGPPPAGGALRADANCDGLINVADIVFYLNYLYGAADDPCH